MTHDLLHMILLIYISCPDEESYMCIKIQENILEEDGKITFKKLILDACYK